LTIKQRDYIPEIKVSDFSDLDFDRLKQIFNTTSIHKIKAELDAMRILGAILSEEPSSINEKSQEVEDGEPVELTKWIIEEFVDELKMKRYKAFREEELEEDELPAECILPTKLYLSPTYFIDPEGDGNFRLPKMLKQLVREGEATYEARVKNYLLCTSDDQFAQIGSLIDPNNGQETVFFELYNEVCEERVKKVQKPNC